MGSESSTGLFRSEFRVDDLPRKPSLARVGEDLLDAFDPWRNSGDAVPETLPRPEGEGSGDVKPPWARSSDDGARRDFTAGDSVPGIREVLPDAREVSRRPGAVDFGR